MMGEQKRRIQSASNLSLAILCFLVLHVQGQYGGGTGEPDDPYLIYTAQQMNNIGLRSGDWHKHFKLMTDIDLSDYAGTNFNIIGYFADWQDNMPFTGIFDGNRHTISNFTHTSPDTSYVGLFAYVEGGDALIRDLVLSGPNLDVGSGHDVGALVGYLRDGTITGCSIEGGSVSGGSNVGGLVGAHGELGIWPPYTISNCCSTSNVRGIARVGGLVGHNDGTIVNCFSAGSVTGITDVGGLVGRNGAILYFSWGDPVDGPGIIFDCYSTASVFGTGDNSGGLVGLNYAGEITKCYATGSVGGQTCVGGLVGANRYSASTIAASFWDVETTGRNNMCGTEALGVAGCDDTDGKTTAEMQTANTFLDAGWDFVNETANGTEDIWWILEGKAYPRLWWQYGQAFSPHPHNDAIDVTQPLLLSWLPGGSFFYHDIYIGDDREAIANATTANSETYRGRQAAGMTTFDPGPLQLGKTYYWRTDEVNEADRNNPWRGDIWRFTTADFLVVDDFESYNDMDPPSDGSGPNRIFDIWIDGFGTMTNGAIVGFCQEFGFPSRRCHPQPIHGGSQSMDFYYDTSGTANYAEATRTLIDLRDWTRQGARVLSLWFHGDPNNAPGPIYVGLANVNHPAAIVYHDNPDAVSINEWTEWEIDLQKFAEQGVDIANVDSISIGLGDKNSPQAGGTGVAFFDDIRLCRR